MMAEVNLTIEGMSCQHCVMRVKKAVDQLPGVSKADVNVGTAKITYDEARIKKEDLEKAVEGAGYKIRE
jgi:copper chaperone